MSARGDDRVRAPLAREERAGARRGVAQRPAPETRGATDAAFGRPGAPSPLTANGILSYATNRS